VKNSQNWVVMATNNAKKTRSEKQHSRPNGAARGDPSAIGFTDFNKNYVIVTAIRRFAL
jgi:hypothetical protein